MEVQLCCSNARTDAAEGSASVKFRERSFQTEIPSILANVCSLLNKMDEQQLLNRINKDFSNLAVLCFSETWLSEGIPDNALHLLGFQLFRADRIAELTG